MIKQWIIAAITEAVKEMIESGKVAIWLDSFRSQLLVWLEPQLRALALKSENTLDDALVDIIINFLKK